MTAGPDAVPIACSLDAGALGERAGEWRALVASPVSAVEADDTAVRLVPRDSEAIPGPTRMAG